MLNNAHTQRNGAGKVKKGVKICVSGRIRGRKLNKAQFEIEISRQREEARKKTAMKSTLGGNKRKQPVSSSELSFSGREKPLEKKEVLDYFPVLAHSFG